jgi:hypothetical protein
VLAVLVACLLAVAVIPAATLTGAGSPAAAAASAAPPPAPGGITLSVESARSVADGPGFVHEGDAVTAYKWMINVDDTGDPGTAANSGTQNCLPPGATGGSSDPDFAETCPWPSIRNTSGWTEIVAQGDQGDLDSATALDGLPGGKYLISVTADGFKIDGAHFTVDGGTTPVVVRMNPTPLPLATIRIQVFEDQVPVDSTYEADAERGLAGFGAHLTDVLGEVSTDYYGNALCTAYQHTSDGTTPSGDPADPILFVDDRPVVDAAHNTGRCTSDATGEIVIPNLGSDRYAATVTPPAAQASQWVQTTTLEGALDWDIWVQEGETGFDNELLKGGEPVPMVQFGFAKRKPSTGSSATGAIKGRVVEGLSYIGGPGGAAYEAVLPGMKSGGPIKNPWVSISDLDAGDAALFVGQGNPDGSFLIPHVPDGTYQLSLWDESIDHILWSYNVTVSNGATTDVGEQQIVGWFTHLHGHVFIDSNENGKRDPGETSVPAFPVTIRERDNSLMDQYTNTSSTDTSGAFDIKETYPLSKWLIFEAFDTRYRTTGISYRGDNERAWTTTMGGLVDLNFLPVIGLGGEIDWGVKPLATGTNGGIAGTVTYDTTRNEYDPSVAATEPYQPGIPDVPLNLYISVPCPVGLTTAQRANQCSRNRSIVPLRVPDPSNPGQMMTNPDPQRGAFVKATDANGDPAVLNSYVSEQWQPPHGCTAYDFTGQPLTQQHALPQFGELANRMCLEAPMMGVNFGPSDKTPGEAGQTVNGNYGFATSTLNQWPVGNANNPALNHDLPLWADLAANAYDEQPLRANDYIVEVEVPDNPVGGGAMYEVTQEEDVNVFDGDAYLPQENMSALTPAEAGAPPDPATPQPEAGQPPSQQGGIVSPCAGPLHTVGVTVDNNPNFLAGGGSPFEGQDRPDCAAKLITVRTGQTAAPNFNLFTPVPLPTHFWGLTINDLGLTHDARSVNYGEAQGIPFVPVGLYDYAGRLMDTVHTDFNGMYEALEPSTSTYNCPLPAGPCPNMYKFVGNDPGQPGALNPDYNPRFRTIAATFQGWPGLYTVTDEAPTQVGMIGLAPDGTNATPVQCDLGSAYPQLFSVSNPVVALNGSAAARTVTIKGSNFGSTAGTLTVGPAPGGTASNTLTASSWSDTQITFQVPLNSSYNPNNSPAFRTGARPLRITRAGAGGRTSVNGITLQIVSGAGANSADNPRVIRVGPGQLYDTVQRGLQAAQPTNANRFNVVVVYPGAQTSLNPRGEYTENVIVHSAVHLIGVGPGGFQGTTFVPGSILDGLGFNADNDQGAAWIALLGSLNYSGQLDVPTGAVVTVLDNPRGPTAANWNPSISGFTLTGGVQTDTPTNINTTTGGTTTPYGATGALVTQGGGVYVHANVRNLQISDNVIVGNSGSYGGGIRIGTPYLANNRNTGAVIARNQVRDNGGTNLAGGIGLFRGSDGYQVVDNAICGNYSAEYGGGISAYGYMGTGANGGGTISRNKIWFNGSYDEGGGILVGGELPATPTQLSEGSGPVTIEHNTIEANIANDDGAGIRLLMTSGSHITPNQLDRARIADNTIVNNVSAHEGGGIALDDAVFVDIVNNTIAKNLTTATAVTSDGRAAPAGLSTASNSDPLQSRLQSSFTSSAWTTLRATYFSKPVQFNDVYYDNRAGSWNGSTISGIGTLPNGFAGGINNWDMGTIDVGPGSPFLLSPTNSVIQSTQGYTASSSNTVTSAPGLVSPFDLSVDIGALRANPVFRQSLITAVLLPLQLLGDYHLSGSSSAAYNWGTRIAKPAPWGSYNVSAPTLDIDGQTRASGGHYDAGSDQVLP